MHLKLHLFPYSPILTCVLGAQKNRLILTVLLSTHNICFDQRINKTEYTTNNSRDYLNLLWDRPYVLVEK